MRVFWEKTGVLYPIYCLVGRGWNNDEIAAKLHTSELTVQSCIAWILNFLGLRSRGELVQHAAHLGGPLAGRRDRAQFRRKQRRP